MRILKALAFALVGLSVVLLTISSLLPGRVVNSRSVMVAAPPDTILAELRDLPSWPAWNLLLQDASQVRTLASGAKGVQGATLLWHDARGGDNAIRLTQDGPDGIVTELRLNGGDPMESGFSIDRRFPDSVQLHWYVIEELAWYPWEKFYGMVSGGMKEDAMRQSLIRLRDRIHRRRRGSGPRPVQEAPRSSALSGFILDDTCSSHSHWSSAIAKRQWSVKR